MRQIPQMALVIIAVLVAIVVVIGIIWSLGWPWWVGIFILIGLFGLCLGLILMTKWWARRREQHFVDQVIEQDNARLKALDERERERSKELQNRWKDAMEALRRSHLRKQGNPLYVLPWYLVIGESGSGKTTAIESARLSSPFADFARASGISGTRNCDWWFFEQAIIIDTAGRYAIPVDAGRDKEEWQQFLTLLARFRKKEPLNGLVVTIAADKVLTSGPEALSDDGRSIRRRIDELMRVLGAKFPVYVLVTKCDLIEGMTQFCDRLPEKVHEQAMGFLNHDRTTDAAGFHDRLIYTMGERLRDLRILLFHETSVMGARQGLTQGIDPGLLLFPEEFEGLKQGLKAFINGAFEENPYQETPILRGLFFSSGRQEGSPYSQFLKALGLIEEREVLPGTSKGLFLHDFFSRILPRDRRLSIPTSSTNAWRQLTRNIGLTAWFALAVAICGLLSFSFVKNLRTLGDIRASAEPPVFRGETLTDMELMDRFRHALLEVEDRNQNWWIPRFGLNESKNVEIQLKGKYCNQFDERFLSAYDKQMADKITNMSESTPDDVFGQWINLLVKRINLLRARLEGEDFERLSGRPQPPFEPIVWRGDQTLVPEIGKTFSTLYLSALWWRPDSGTLNQEMNTLQSWLRHLLTRKRTDLHWLVAWVNASAPPSALTLDTFWGGEKGPVSGEKTVPGAFTLEGKKKIDSFLTELESALPEPLIIAGQKQEFGVWYRKAYIGAWHDFGAIFPRGEQKFKGTEDARLAAAAMAKEGGPYFSLLNRMVEELEPFSMGDDLPPWIQLVYDFKGVRDQAAGLDTFEDKGALATVRRKGEKLIKRMEKGISRFEGGQPLESQLIAAKAFRDYQKALTEIAPASAAGMEASRLAAQTFSEDRHTSKSPFFAAQDAVNKLRVSLGGSAQPKEKMFWSLVTGPLDYLWAFVCQETACHLQDAWEKEVLVEIHGISERQARDQLLFGEEGYATKFIEGQAGPFVSRSRQKGFYAKEVLNRKITFYDSFFAFYNKGVTNFIPQGETEPVKANYPVFVKGLPTDTNKEARVRPHATILEVQCGTERQRLENLNYPVNKTFNWSPQTCGDVILEIQVGHLILSRRYTGDKAFPRFLKDFEKGSSTFYPADFPDDEPTLRRFGIQKIIVNYQFRGQGPLLALLRPKPKIRVPETIAKCWDQ